jgi:nucleoside-specific outer membrane channel protein Tsx
MFKKVIAPIAVACLGLFAQSAHALEWSDNQIRYWWGPSFREPGVQWPNGQPRDIPKNILSFTHANGYQWGGNFLNIDLLKSAHSDPAVGGDTGAIEAYVTARSTLSFNKISGTKNFSFGPIRDVMLEFGGDIGVKNNEFAERKIMPVIGPAVAFNVPGFWNVAVLANKEWNNNGIVGKAVQYSTTVMFSTAWDIPIGSLPLTFEGFANINLPKGKDGFGNDTKTEILLHPKLMWDVASLWQAKSGFRLGLGWEWWNNKFGNDSRKTPGALANTYFIEAAYHF